MGKRSLVILLFAVVVPSVLLLLADLVIGDYELFMLMNKESVNCVLDALCAYGSPVLFSVFYLLTLVRLYFSDGNRFLVISMLSLTTGPLSYGIGSMLKPLVARPRPFEVLLDVRVVGPWESSSFSFPSTTTMLAFGFTIPILLLFEKHKYGIGLSLLFYLIGFSVIYTGFHYPSDVVAGILVSALLSLCTSRMEKHMISLIKRLRGSRYCARSIFATFRSLRKQ